jgi:type VI secretion system VgrG family protein
MFKDRNIKIDKLELLSLDYFVYNLVIQEGLSEVTYLIATIILIDKSVWDVDIPFFDDIEVHIKTFKPNNELYERFFHGRIVHIEKKIDYNPLHGNDGQYVIELHIKHHLYNLALHNDFHIFKDMSIGEILQDICTKHHIIIVNSALILSSRPDRLVQYGENTLHFFERLLQYYGCYYICEQDTNIVNIYEGIIGYEEVDKEVSILEIRHNNLKEIDTLLYVNMVHTLKPEMHISRNYNYQQPLKLEGMSVDPFGKGKLFTYPTSANNDLEAERNAKNISKKFRDKIFEGISYCFYFKPGKKIFIRNIESAETHVIFKVTHTFSTEKTININSSQNYYYENLFSSMHGDKSFVIDKIYIKPTISSIQTATVTGLSDINEIEINDKHEILVKFNWCHEEEAKCWVPLAQSMAGKCFGSRVFPRIDEEVLIYFFNGDPDKPVVYGSIHTDRNRNYALEPEDKYRTYLMRSHTFFEEDVLSYNEISMKDIKEEEEFYMRARKKLKFQIGHKDTIENHFSIGIDGKGDKIEYINDGDFLLDLRNGLFVEKIRGDYETHITRGEKGGNYLIRVTEGGLIITARDIIDIQVTGDCRIKSDSIMDIHAAGLLFIHSDEEIRMSAPRISAIADDAIHQKAGVDIKFEAGERINQKAGIDIELEAVECINQKAGVDIKLETGEHVNIISGLDTSVKSGATIIMDAAEDISFNTLGCLRSKAAALVSFDSDLFMANTLTEFHVMSALAIILESSLDLRLTSGLSLSVDSGMSVSVNSGLAIDITSGLETHISSGLSTGIDSGLSCNISSGLDLSINSGLDVSLDSGLDISLNAGLKNALHSGLLMSMDAGLELDANAGLSFTIIGGLLGDIRTTFTKFMSRPAL